MKKGKGLVLLVMTFIMLIPFVSVKAEDSLFVADNSINEAGEKFGTIFNAGNTITTDAKVDGISFLAGNIINFNGTTEYAIYAGNMVNINGSVVKDAFIAGNSITFSKDAVLPRDVYMAGASIVLNSNIGRNLYVSSEKIKIDNVTIEGNATISSSEIVFGENVTINGTLKYNKSAEIEGISKVVYTNISTYDDSIESIDVNGLNKLVTEFKFISLVGLLLLGTLTVLIFPNLFKKILKETEILNTGEVFKRIGLGFLTLIFLPILSIMLIFTLVGFPIGGFSLAFCFVSIYYSTIITGYIIGNLILTKLIKSKENSYLSVLMGVTLIWLIKLIPFIGVFIGFISLIFGIGVITKLVISKK